MTSEFWQDRRVLLTGHTGFKGAWLALWLEHLGAEVHGISLPPGPGDMYERLDGWSHRSTIADLTCDPLPEIVAEAAPEVVFHLAAQATVLEGYRDPARTFATNVMGTVNLLEALRDADDLRAMVVVTTDKVYGSEPRRFGEADNLCATDPYSGSKVAQEAVVASFRHSYFDGRAGVVAARAGNVIGGGDDGANRLIPDCVRAMRRAEPIVLRHPDAVRPWQHVLDPLHGYMKYAEAAADRASVPPSLNFGPDRGSTATVAEVVRGFLGSVTGGESIEVRCEPGDPGPRETHHLSIDASAARATLDWKPTLDLPTALRWTGSWYSKALTGAAMRNETIAQIQDYEEMAA